MPRQPERPRVVPAELIEQWKATQTELRRRLVIQPLKAVPRFVAGADAAFADDVCKVVACAVVYDREERRMVEVAHAVQKLEAPYVPTFLSFREGPCVMDAIGKLKHPFDIVCFDGQGYAHPRRCGLASHVSVSLDVCGIGCAKTRLIGTFDEPADKAGASSPLMDKEEQIGIVLRTRAGTKYRIPEPTRLADIEVAKIKLKVLAGEL